MNTPDRQTVILASLLGVSGVLMAAAGSHWIPDMEDAGRYHRWQAANFMHFGHALALLALSVIPASQTSWAYRLTGWSWAIGVILFSGTIYAALWLPDISTRLAPAGGMLLMLGWLALLVPPLRSGR